MVNNDKKIKITMFISLKVAYLTFSKIAIQSEPSAMFLMHAG